MEKIRKLEESKILITLIYSMYIMYTQIHRKKHNNQNNIKLYIDLMSQAFQRRSPAKGQGSGASRWPEGVKVDLPADTSMGGPKPLCSKDPSITVTYLPCVDLCWPQGSSLLFLSSLFTPNQSQIRASLHDKVLWKTRVGRRKRFLSVAGGEQILCPQEVMVTWF